MLSINTNQSAIQDLFNLANAQSEIGLAMQRLSSGLRINSAVDDPAGLAISGKMQMQIAGLDQAVANGQAGIAMLQTADGALSQSQAIVQQMRSLAVEAANGTLTPTDRQAIQLEVNQLAQQLTNIAKQTQFNQQNLLDGSLQNLTLQVGANAGQTIAFSIGAMDANSLGLQSVQAQVSGSPAATEFTQAPSVPTGSALAVGTTYNIAFGATTVTVTSSTVGTPSVPTGSALAGGSYSIVLSSDSYAYLVNSSGVTVAKSASTVAGAGTGVTITFNDLTVSGQKDLQVVTSATLPSAPSSGSVISLGTASVTVTLLIQSLSGTTIATATNPTTSANGVISFYDATTAAQVDLVLGTGSTGLTVQSGTSIGQVAPFYGGPIVTDQTSAQNAITKLDTAMSQVTSQRAVIGAVQNRLQATISALQVASQNLKVSNGVIADANIPREMMNLTRAQVLLQAGVSMLVQANTQPQLLLRIITG